MGLALAITAPSIKRVIHHHAVFEHCMVVREVGGETERQRQQSWRLRREIEPRGIGAADDQRERAERRVIDPVTSRNASKPHNSPSWENGSAPGMS